MSPSIDTPREEAPRAARRAPRRTPRSPSTIAIEAVLKMPLGQLVQFANDMAERDQVTARFLHEKLGAALAPEAS